MKNNSEYKKGLIAKELLDGRDTEKVRIYHQSDCALHNEPAYPNGECDCIPVIALGEKEKMQIGDLVLIKEARGDEDIAPKFIAGVFLSKCGESAIVTEFVKGEINGYANVKSELLQNIIAYEKKDIAEHYIRSITENCITELTKKIITPSKEVIKDDVAKKWYLHKKQIIETATNMIKYDDDGNEEAFKNRLKTICIWKKYMFEIKSPLLDSIHKQNGMVKWKINTSKDNLEESLKAIELLEEIRKQNC